MKTLAAKRVRWTVKDYFRMADAGLFDGRRVELLDGEVIEVSAQGHLHMRSIAGTASMLLPVFFPANMVAIQGTLPLGKYGAPDPDLYVCDVPAGTPLDQIPLPFLVIEVSDTTYPKDSGIKLRTYARAGVPDYWIINIPQDRVEVYRRPENPTGRRSGWRYADIAFYRRGQQVSLLLRPQVSLAVDVMLP